MQEPRIEAADPASRTRQQQAALQRGWAALLRAWPHLRGRSLREPWEQLPFTTKADLRNGYPLQRIAVPQHALRRVHASSGTSGIPTVVAYTAADLALWSRLVSRGLAALGVGPGTRIHSTLGYGLFTGGLGFHAAAEALGACVVPAAAGNSPRHRRLIADLNAEVLFSTPSYAMHLAESAEAPLPSLRLGVFGAEPMGETMRSRLQDAWGMQAYDTYGLSEAIGPGVAWECLEREGLHVNADAFIAEVIDPVTGELLPDGEEGELVLTAPTKEAMPLLRYRTGDRTAICREPCRCGRTLPRLMGIRGRVDGMLTVRGVNVYPSQIEVTLLAFPSVRCSWRASVRRVGSLDQLTIEAEAEAPHAPDLLTAIQRRLRAALGMKVAVQLLPPGTLPEPAGKAQRLLDLRSE